MDASHYLLIAGAIVLLMATALWYESQLSDNQTRINSLLIRNNQLEAEADQLAQDVVERDIEIADQAETIHSWVLTQLGHQPIPGNDPAYDWPDIDEPIPFTLPDSHERG